MLVSVLGNLYAMVRVQGMRAQIDDLREYIAQLPTMQAMPDEVGSSTESKSEDIADASLEYCTFDGQQYLIYVSAMPKLFDETESAQFVLRSEGGSAFYEVSPTAFTGEYTTVLRTSVPDCSVYLTLTKGDQTRSLLVGECKGLGCCPRWMRRYIRNFHGREVRCMLSLPMWRSICSRRSGGSGRPVRSAAQQNCILMGRP